ncbi:hypothetical protein [Halovivax cerinus]|uniref:Uncharacterized protein n=1 Tax=Halovivax cerinus TaxID=1487865 RepID=A0ABD5NSB4_9EURY|nr:hypothetical protein [Halovivax cerinus]
MIERQDRNGLRDGALFLLGVVGIVLVEVVASSGPGGSEQTAMHGFLFGCSVGIMCSGIFRATGKQAISSTVALGIGFAFGAVVDVF